MEVIKVNEAVTCPQCGVGNEQGLFHISGSPGCADCLLKYCTTSDDRLVITGVTVVEYV